VRYFLKSQTLILSCPSFSWKLACYATTRAIGCGYPNPAIFCPCWGRSPVVPLAVPPTQLYFWSSTADSSFDLECGDADIRGAVQHLHPQPTQPSRGAAKGAAFEMGCTRKASVFSFTFVVAAVILSLFILTNSTIPKPKTAPLDKQTFAQTAWSSPLTHRDAKHLPREGKASPFFELHSVSGRVQAQRAYWEHLAGRVLRGRERRQLLGAVQNMPINGTLETG
jgi:hypothetical protein